MNILIIPSWYRNKTQPNNGSFFREQAKSLANKGYNIYILDASLRVKKGWFSNDCMKFSKQFDENIIVYSYNFPSLFFGRFPLVYCFIYYLSMRYLLKKLHRDGINIDLVHAHSAYAAGFVVTKSKLFTKVPIVVTEHNSIFNKKIKNKSLKYILNETLLKSDTFICVSDDLAQNVKINSNIDKLITVIPNMVNPIFKYKSPKIKEDFTFLSVGNLIENKRMDLLITAFSETFKNNNNVSLKIVGIGKERENLINLINKYKMDNRITLLGEVNKNELLLEYENSDVFVLVSESETFGLAYREAMAVGRPIISTLNGGINSDKKDYNGVFIPVDNKKELKKALSFMKENVNKFDGEIISKKILEKYGEDVVINKIINCYKVLNGGLDEL